jgi:glycosyltransferase involved in cell wall biosynthesis
MKIILFTHPKFLGSQSMPRYAQMLSDGMYLRGHEVKIWAPNAFFYLLPFSSIKKWLGYIDQYILFPIVIKFKLIFSTQETLFVFVDQALGPWVPLVNKRPHVIHCHDFLALKSSLGLVPENATSFTGKIYQKFIRNGFSRGSYFISVSQKTQTDLFIYHLGKIISAEVCYNGMNRVFEPVNQNQSRLILENQLNINLSNGYLMHIGGNQYYKNRSGVLEIYEQFRLTTSVILPLLLIGEKPSDKLLDCYTKSKFKSDIHFIQNLHDEFINYAYSGATCLLFPSLDEGFGWPIAEAMASGCIVITTNTAPMSEVNGDANYFSIPRKPSLVPAIEWAEICARNILKVINLSDIERERMVKIGIESSKRFDAQKSLDKIESIYNNIISESI